MKSKRKKNRNIQQIKSRLGVSRKKNYTKERKVDIRAPIDESIESEISIHTNTNIFFFCIYPIKFVEIFSDET